MTVLFEIAPFNQSTNTDKVIQLLIITLILTAIFLLPFLIIFHQIFIAFIYQAFVSTSHSFTIDIIFKMIQKNVLGTALKMCCDSPMTGFYRDGFCKTGPYDYGKHLVCAQVTQQFLQFSKQRGNDLTKPSPQHGFPGLSPGDKWCLCAMRWLQAHQAGLAPKIDLEASHQKLLEFISLDKLQTYQIAHPH